MVKGIGLETEAGEVTVEPQPQRADGAQESWWAAQETTGYWRAHASPGGAGTHSAPFIHPDPCDLRLPAWPAHGAPPILPAHSTHYLPSYIWAASAQPVLSSWAGGGKTNQRTSI